MSAALASHSHGRAPRRRGHWACSRRRAPSLGPLRPCSSAPGRVSGAPSRCSRGARDRQAVCQERKGRETSPRGTRTPCPALICPALLAASVRSLGPCHSYQTDCCSGHWRTAATAPRPSLNGAAPPLERPAMPLRLTAPRLRTARKHARARHRSPDRPRCPWPDTRSGPRVRRASAAMPRHRDASPPRRPTPRSDRS